MMGAALMIPPSVPGSAPRSRGPLLRIRGQGFPLLAWVLATTLTLLVLYPLGRTVFSIGVSEQGLSGAIDSALKSRDLDLIIRNTATIVGLSVLLAAIIGSVFAWLSERTDASMGWVTRLLPIIPMLIPPVAGSVGWVTLGAPVAGYVNVFLRWVMGIFGSDITRGPLVIQSWYGAVFVYMLYLVPLVYITVAAALRNVDPAIEEAARSCGAKPAKVAMTITLPSVRPAIGAGVLLSLIYGLSLYSVPAVLLYSAGTEVLSVRIVNLMREYPPRIGTAMGLGVLMMATIGTGLWLQRRMLRRSRFATIGGRSARPMPIRLGVLRLPARILMVGYIVFTALLPLFGLLVVSLQPFWNANVQWASLTTFRYQELLSSSTQARQALVNSITISTYGATVAMIVAAVVSVYAGRRMSSAVGRITDFTTKLPGAVSNVIIGVAFIGAFAGPPFRLSGTLLILFLAYIVITLPQSSFNASAAYAQVGRDLEEASLASGATQGRTFRKIIIPLMIPGLAAGWAMVFVLMAGDVTASALLAGPGNPVVGSFMLDQVNFGTYGMLTAVGVLLVLLSAVVVFSFLWVSRRMGVGRSRE
jgi:iron(III) transport system permease protein